MHLLTGVRLNGERQLAIVHDVWLTDAPFGRLKKLHFDARLTGWLDLRLGFDTADSRMHDFLQSRGCLSFAVLEDATRVVEQVELLGGRAILGSAPGGATDNGSNSVVTATEVKDAPQVYSRDPDGLGEDSGLPDSRPGVGNVPSPPATADPQQPSPEPSRVASSLNATRVKDIEFERAREIVSNFSARVHAAYVPPAGEIAAALEEMEECLREVQQASDSMRRALEAKGVDVPAQHHDQDQVKTLSFEDWSTETYYWTLRASESLPMLKSNRLNRLKELQNGCVPLLAQESRQREVLRAQAATQIESALRGPFDSLRSTLGAAWAGALSDQPRESVVDWWIPAWVDRQLVLGRPVRPAVSPASARLSTVRTKVALAGPAPSSKVFDQSVSFGSQSVSSAEEAFPHFQVHIDLDRDGGFITSDKVAIETAAVDLLGQLPGGRVKVDVVDPLQLGDSARFLFELNDAGDRILADSVWTTTEHIAKILVQLEEHITFVTQKYLQGRNSLTEYNVEAGEIAEPYRLLVLYDYPAGFSRDGRHFEEEHLTRLERIAAVGRRAGVYIFAHVSNGQTTNRLDPLVRLTPSGLGLEEATSADNQQGLFQARIESYEPLWAEALSEDGHVGRISTTEILQALGLTHVAPTHTARHVPVGRWAWVTERDNQVDGVPAWTVVAMSSESGVDPSTAGVLTVTDARFGWEVTTNAPPGPNERKALFAGLLRDLQDSETAKVDPFTIGRLSQQRHAADMEKGLAVESLVDAADMSTWWKSTSVDRLQLAFGRMGASGIARVEFNSALESSALIGGRTGSGKSYLIHALIMDAITRYSPEELALYLCDLKEGVEFKQYADARLPHARAIAVDSNREFAVSLLEALDREIADRGALFKAKAGGTAVNISQFRRESGQTWPRVMIVIDEFHKLFEQDDRLARRASQLLERVIKEGRAFGVHTVLASQSLANVDASFKSLAGQIPYRLVLASSDNDSRILLGDDNADAKLLTKAGEGILNAKGGARESNQRFQTTYWGPEQRQEILDGVSQLAGRSGFDRHPHVFEGNAEVLADDYDAGLYRGDGQSVLLPIGVPMSMEPPVITRFERSPGSNLLIVDPDGLGTLSVLLTSLLAQRVDVTAVDFAAVEREWEPAVDVLVGEGLAKPNRRRIDDVVEVIAKEVAERHANSEYRAVPKVLALIGVHRARELDPDDYDDDALLAKVRGLVRDGPEVGVHVIAWADRKASLDRRLDSQTLKEFGLRLLGRMSEDDSRSLADTEQASSITPAQLVFDDFDGAVTLVARRLGFPGVEWVRDVVRGA